VDELIDERLAANRSAYLRSSLWTRATLNITVAAVVATGAIIGFLFLARSRDSTTNVITESSPVAPRYKPPTTPTWWDVDLSVDMAYSKNELAKSQLKGLAGPADLVASPDPSQRAAGYEQLLERVRSGSDRQDILPAALR